MINRLHLENFGKFKNCSFEIGKATVFYGGNESGKTTVFDALLCCLCEVPKTGKIGKEIYARYGNDFRIRADFNDSGFKKFDLAEFMNLYAIRAGKISFSISSGSGMSLIKSGVFTGGINPNQLVERFLKMSSDDRKLVHNRGLYDAYELKKSMEKKLDALLDERARLAAMEDDKKRKISELDMVMRELNKLSAMKKRCEDEISAHEKSMDTNRYQSILDDIRRKKEITEELMSAGKFEKSDVNTVRVIEAKIDELMKKRDETGKYLRNSLASMAFNKNPDNDIETYLNRLINRLDNYRHNPVFKEKFFLKWNFFITGMSASLLSLIPFLLTDAKWMVFITVLLTVMTIFLSIGKRRKKDAVVEGNFIEKVKDEIHGLAGIKPVSDNVDGIYEEILRISDSISGKHDVKTRTEIESVESNLNEYDAEIDRLKRRLEDWYNDRGVRNFEEYIDVKNRNNLLGEELTRLDGRIEGYKKTLCIESEIGLKKECERRINLLNNEAGTTTNNENTGHIKLNLEKLNYKGKMLNGKREVLEKMIVRLDESVRILYESVPLKILETEQSLEEIKSKIKEIELTKESASGLTSLFQEMAAETGTAMKELVGEMKSVFGDLVPGVRDILVTDLDDRSIYIGDAGGEIREIDFLSDGTKESFYLASKLLYAKKTCPEKNRIMIFDDPFLSFDDPKKENAIEMLKNFSDGFGFTIVLLIKEERLVERIKKSFGDSLVINPLVSRIIYDND